ncbi:MAG: 1-phosphofructokinase family hexose kinase, partial [Erysipelotrichaceae bacterium]|nr:1-phosphofructokinase family hexose kinase [Erysipelotrichaceae bacterium]
MIHTLTLNPSVDYFIWIDGEIKKDINRSDRYFFLAGGKGINVSIILNNLQIDSAAHVFLGGFSGSFVLQEVERLYPHVKVVNTPIEGNTRINVKVRNGDEMDFNTSGPEIMRENLDEFLSNLDSIAEGDYVVLSGSHPRGIDNDTVIEIARKVREKGGKLVLDVPNLDCKTLGEARPYLIKPNNHELSMLFGEKLEGIDQYDEKAGALIDMGVENVLLSLGAEGALFVSKQGKYRISHPAFEAVSTVGAGDSMLAAFVGSAYSGQ